MGLILYTKRQLRRVSRRYYESFLMRDLDFEPSDRRKRIALLSSICTIRALGVSAIATFYFNIESMLRIVATVLLVAGFGYGLTDGWGPRRHLNATVILLGPLQFASLVALGMTVFFSFVMLVIVYGSVCWFIESVVQLVGCA